MKKISFIFLFFLFAAQAFSLDGWETATKSEFLSSYKKAMEWFGKTQKFSVSISYSSYIDHTSTSPFEKSEGLYIKDGKKAYSNVLGIKTVQNELFRFSVDTSEKLIILNNMSESELSVIDMKSFEMLLENAKTIKKQKSATGGISYKIEFKPDMLYSSFEIELNENGLLKIQRFFYATEMKEESNDSDEYGNVNKSSVSSKPRLEISFSNYQTQLRPELSKEFSEKKYFSQSGKKIILAERYKAFQLKDYRFDPKK
jgi:hypothetical protein